MLAPLREQPSMGIEVASFPRQGQSRHWDLNARLLAPL